MSIKEKHKLYQTFIFSPTPVNAKLYKTFRNRLKTLIKKVEINYYLEAFNDKKYNIKEIWKQLSYLLNSKSTGLFSPGTALGGGEGGSVKLHPDFVES